MTRIFLVIAITILLVPGCGEKGAQTDRTPESTEVKGQDVVQPAAETTMETGMGGTAEEKVVDPAFNDYIYPGSELGGSFPWAPPSTSARKTPTAAA